MLPTNGTRLSGRTRRAIAALGVAGIGLTVPCLTAGTASAASVATWDKVAQCESTGNWSINTGNGFFGGLQFTNSTWAAFGGTSFAARADLATKDQQIAIAEKVLAVQGPGAWPVCSVQAGLTKGGTPAAVDTSATAAPAAKTPAPAPAPAAKPAAKPAEKPAERQPAAKPAAQPETQAPAASDAAPQRTGAQDWQKWHRQAGQEASADYTVVAGDWLSSIADKNSVQGGWERLYELNRATLAEGPHSIYPGQHLTLGDRAEAKAPAADKSGQGFDWFNRAKEAQNGSGTAAEPATGTPAKAETPAPAPAATGSMAAAVSFAQSKVGQAYVYGGTGNGGWDCSGLTQAALRAAGVSVPRVAADQAAASTHVSLDSLKAGDLLFWSNNGQDSGVYHVALYVGDGKYVEAANPSSGVRVQTVANWAPDFAGRV
ncbi:transglycosylase family protein [Kitasatospora purpeofusca]|uniref:transglycosylase family protein n=1 Tax=Kitasatospora purpeofusca TaxID=67352 RepID=UPI002A5AF53D|nr:transglycosylase family protein [Kitasatospora purpeofusca]MDY0814850.1 transglycosylase family protein [Kitasatospora purpeofusca]